MTTRDPLQVLHAEEPSGTARSGLRRALRARLESALSLPLGSEGVVMSQTAATVEPPRPAALPYLTVGDARAAIAWYRDAFGAEVAASSIVMDDGRIGHAELRIGDGVSTWPTSSPRWG